MKDADPAFKHSFFRIQTGVESAQGAPESELSKAHIPAAPLMT